MVSIPQSKDQRLTNWIEHQNSRAAKGSVGKGTTLNDPYGRRQPTPKVFFSDFHTCAVAHKQTNITFNVKEQFLS